MIVLLCNQLFFKKGDRMKLFKKLMMLVSFSIISQSMTFASDDENNDDVKPKHQGFGRIFTAVENTVTLHPGNAVNSLATGNQDDTTFGYHKDEQGKVKANKANTRRNNANKKAQQKRKEAQAKKNKSKKNQADKPVKKSKSAKPKESDSNSDL